MKYMNWEELVINIHYDKNDYYLELSINYSPFDISYNNSYDNVLVLSTKNFNKNFINDIKFAIENLYNDDINFSDIIRSIFFMNYYYDKIIVINDYFFNEYKNEYLILTMLDENPKYIDKVINFFYDLFQKGILFENSSNTFFDCLYTYRLLVILDRYNKQKHFNKVFEIYSKSEKRMSKTRPERIIMIKRFIKILFTKYLKYIDIFLEEIFDIYTYIDLNLIFNCIYSNTDLDDKEKEKIILKVMEYYPNENYVFIDLIKFVNSIELKENMENLLLKIFVKFFNFNNENIKILLSSKLPEKLSREIIDIKISKLKVEAIKNN